MQEALALHNNAEQQIQKALSDLDGAIKYVTQGANQHPNRLDICQAKGGDPSQSQQPPTGPRAGSGALSSASAFGQPPFRQPSAPATIQAPAFGQSSFGQSSIPAPAPAPAPAFGNPSFGKAAAPAPAFGQPTALGQKPTIFGQPSNPNSAPAFGQSSTPSPFGQLQQAATPSGLQQSQQQPAIGQQSGPFVQQSATEASTKGSLGQQPALTTSNPFATAPTTSSGFGRPTAAPTSTFGQPTAPQPSDIFGRSSTSQATANPFSSQATGQTSGAFGQSRVNPALVFRQPAAPASTGIFGRPSAPATSTGVSAPTAPVNTGGPITSKTPSTPMYSGAPTHATFGPGKPGDRKLLTWQGLKVEYVYHTDFEGEKIGEAEPCIKTRGDNGWQRIWFPEGPITFTDRTPEYPDGYVVDEAARENFKHFLQHGAGSNGLIPDMPPPRDMISWNM
ncbi:MAG: hypothetical protein Q9166_000701 [cf. Caloplaca sp. 2 TL-2023]